MDEPKVSIIVPVYNCKRYIKQCINSLLKQSYSNFEIIIVNDGSNDGTEKILEKYENYSNIKIVWQKNQGSSIARKNGLKQICKDSLYFCFCDADDYLDSKFLMKMVKKSEETNADITQCNYWKFIGKYKYNDYLPDCLQVDKIFDKNQIMDNLYNSFFGITNFPGYLHTKLYKVKFAKIICDLPIVVNFMAEDLSVNIRLIPQCNIITTINEKLYYYRVGGGTSKFMPSFMSDYLNYHKLQLRLISNLNLSESFLYYSQIEIINVFHTWLLMNFIFLNFNKYDLQKEINAWIEEKEIYNALINEQLNENWNNYFFTLVREKNIDSLFTLLNKEKYRKKRKIWIKNIIANFFGVFGGSI